MKEIVEEQTVSAIQREARLKNFSRREPANLRVAVCLPRFQGQLSDGEELCGLERLEGVADVPLNEHIERTVEQEFAKPVDQRQRNLGNLLFGVSRLLPLANISGDRSYGRFACLGGRREEKIFAGLARFGFELEVGEFVALQMGTNGGG